MKTRFIFNILLVAVITFAFQSCKKCTEKLRIGDIAQIPIKFNNFQENEIDQIMLIRIDKSDTSNRDTISIGNITLPNNDKFKRVLEDRPFSKSGKEYGYYESYLDNSDLVLYWNDGSDTLHNISIKKSKDKSIKGCHENDPNVLVDKLEFVHKGKKYNKGTEVTIEK